MFLISAFPRIYLIHVIRIAHLIWIEPDFLGSGVCIFPKSFYLIVPVLSGTRKFSTMEDDSIGITANSDEVDTFFT